ncbi:MAG: SusC/RagA family TonB-linked outer membrane protein [Ekhidna sp.]|uniref:SusC/RagA family TonB-linked outer membrane protein n=1 Tax=Ekhidna sp. TaxID=2608089 RepID=UPI0032EC412B
MKHYLTCLVAMYMAFSLSAQVTLRGTVTDAGNKGIAGATVQIEGTSISALTDATGAFSIQLTDGYETLVISAEGFSPQKIYLTGHTSLNISMKSSSKGNVVNTGIGSQSKDELTSSVSSISAEDVSPAPLINLEQANQGVTAGLFVQNSSGTLGQPTQVRIRGGSSLSASNQPLYVVDGVPLTSQNQSNINPSNIASIEILKDASATAIYGTRAANGVIIITTKDGGSGKMQVNVDYQFGVSETPKKLDIQNGDENLLQTFEYILRGYEDFVIEGRGYEEIDLIADGQTYDNIDRATLEALYNSGVDEVTFVSTFFTSAPPITFNIPGFYNQLRASGSTNWQNEVFRQGTSHRANVDFQGGSEQLGYFASAGYSTQEGILIGNKFDRFNGSLSLDSKITDKLSANLNLNYIYTKDNRLPENQDLGFPLQAIVLPASDTYDPNNNYQIDVRSLEYNPLTEVNYSSNVASNNSVLGGLGFTYQVNDKLSFDVNGGIDLAKYETDLFQGPQTQEGAGTGNGRTRVSDENVTNKIFNGWATYTTDVSGSDKLSVILGGSYQDSKATFTFSDSFFPRDAAIPGSAFAFVSAYTRVSYSLGDQFDFQVSGRMDGSSKFSEANRYGFFPAVSAGWKLNNAPFFNVSTVDLLKLRASYGLVGNTPTDDFLYRQNYYRSTRYGVEATLEPANLANENLKWETTSQFNVGLDFGIMNSRITGSFDYYIKTTSDLLFPVPVSLTSGFSTIFDNIGEMENKGFEINLSSTNVQTSDFSWTTDLNLSSNKNTITELNNQQAIVGVNAFLEGQSAGVFYMKKFVGVDPDTGNALYALDEEGELTTDNWSEAPRMVVGDPNPDLFGGLTNSVAYKNFEFSFMFQFVMGVDLYFQTGEFLSNSGILNLGQSQDQVNRWYAPGDVTNIPKLDPANNFPLSSSRWLSSGDYVRLKNITLTYNFPESVLGSLGGLRNMSIYVSATNLLTFTDYIGYDPDVSYFDPLDGIIGQNISRGVDNFNTPQPRIIMTGIKIGL